MQTHPRKSPQRVTTRTVHPQDNPTTTPNNTQQHPTTLRDAQQQQQQQQQRATSFVGVVAVVQRPSHFPNQRRHTTHFARRC